MLWQWLLKVSCFEILECQATATPGRLYICCSCTHVLASLATGQKGFSICASRIALCASSNDISGARHAGCHAWLWGADVRSFDEVAAHMQDFNNAFSPVQGSADEPR